MLEFINMETKTKSEKDHDFEEIKNCLLKYNLTFSISGNILFFMIRYVKFTIIHEFGTTYSLTVIDEKYGRYAKSTASLEIGFIFLLDIEIDSYINKYFPGLDSEIPLEELWKPHKNKTGYWRKKGVWNEDE